MAEWRPNPIYGAGGGEYVDDLGKIWPDPWGVLNTQAQGATPAAPAGGEMAGGGVDPLSYAAPQPEPGQPPTFAPPAPVPTDDPLAQTAPPAAPGEPPPQPSPGHADRAAAAGANAPPTPTIGMADQKTITSGSSSETGSTGLSPEAQGRAQQGIAQVAGAQGQAREAAASYGTLQANQQQSQSERMLKDAAAGLEKTAAQIALNDHVQSQVERRMQAGAEWRPDRTELFRGDTGVAFGISAAVAAMAGAWMQGRGLTGQNPYLPTIMKMIDDNANDQIRRNSGVMQFLREQKGDLKAAGLELKQRQLRYATQQLDGLALKDSSDLMRAGVEKTKADMLAQDAKWEQEKRQALERTETNKITKTFSQTRAPNAGPPGGERTPDQAKAQAVFDAMDKAYTSAGMVRNGPPGPDGKRAWGVGGGAFPPAALEKINPFDDNEIQANMEAVVEAYGRLQSGGVIGKDERPAFEDQIGMNTLTRAQLAARANAAENMLRARLKSTDAAKDAADNSIPAGWKSK